MANIPAVEYNVEGVPMMVKVINCMIIAENIQLCIKFKELFEGIPIDAQISKVAFSECYRFLRVSIRHKNGVTVYVLTPAVMATGVRLIQELDKKHADSNFVKRMIEYGSYVDEKVSLFKAAEAANTVHTNTIKNYILEQAKKDRAELAELRERVKALEAEKVQPWGLVKEPSSIKSSTSFEIQQSTEVAPSAGIQQNTEVSPLIP